MRTVILIGLVWLAGCKTPVRSPVGAEARATIQQTSGLAEVRSGKGDWVAAEAGRDLQVGDEVRTSSDGQLDVELRPHGGVLTLRNDSVMTIERLGADPEEPNAVAVIRLTRGRVTGDTLKLPKGSKVVVKTKGGTFRIP